MHLNTEIADSSGVFWNKVTVQTLEGSEQLLNKYFFNKYFRIQNVY